MASSSDIVGRIIAALKLSEPNLDTTIGTPIRKVLDAVGDSISDYTNDDYLMKRQGDIDSKVGGDLDDFCSYWGIERLPAQRATGVVTFIRGSSVAATRATVIPVGTQVISYSSPPVFLQTTTSSTLSIGQTSVDVPVQSLIPDIQGNLPSNSISSVTTNLEGVSKVVNSDPITGGLPAETDDQLRERFKATFFRSMAGTDSMYRAIALQTPVDSSDPDSRPVSQVSILGSSTLGSEQLQLSSSAAATTTSNRAAYIYPYNIYVQDSDGNYLTPNHDYTYTLTNPGTGAASLTIQATSAYASEIVTVEYRYVSIYSRNDPGGVRNSNGNINNRVDIWVNGVVAQAATLTAVYLPGRIFTSSAGNLNRSKFTTAKGTQPAVGDTFLQFAYTPILTVPSSLTFGGKTMARGTDYDIVYRSDCFGGGPGASAGLVFYAAQNPPTSTTSFTLDYTFNAVPMALTQAINGWNLLGTDAQVHAGVQINLKFNFVIVYENKFQVSAVNTGIDNALSNYLAKKGFASEVLISNIIEEVSNVPGVKNVRFVTQSDDSNHYGIERILPSGTSVYQTGGKIVDASFDDNSYPVYASKRIIVTAQNTFGSIS